jgi:SAM-dependent methyltransferase
MKKLLNIITKLHRQTKRKYIDRMLDDKISCMQKAKQYDYDYWDGDRRYGYGGYKYDGRYKSVAQDLIRQYNLSNNSSVLDVGCGKAFLLYEIKQLLPDIKIVGFDISKYALECAKEDIKECLFIHNAKDKFDFVDNEFDLVISFTTLHNLALFDLKKSLKEIQRVGKEKYIVVESYRNDIELFNLQCWALTCESFFTPDEWCFIYEQYGYDGDFEFIYFN